MPKLLSASALITFYRAVSDLLIALISARRSLDAPAFAVLSELARSTMLIVDQRISALSPTLVTFTNFSVMTVCDLIEAAFNLDDPIVRLPSPLSMTA